MYFAFVQTRVGYLIKLGRVTPIVVNGIMTVNYGNASSSCMEDVLVIAIGLKLRQNVNEPACHKVRSRAILFIVCSVGDHSVLLQQSQSVDCRRLLCAIHTLG